MDFGDAEDTMDVVDLEDVVVAVDTVEVLDVPGIVDVVLLMLVVVVPLEERSVREIKLEDWLVSATDVLLDDEVSTTGVLELPHDGPLHAYELAAEALVKEEEGLTTSVGLVLVVYACELNVEALLLEEEVPRIADVLVEPENRSEDGRVV